MSKKLGKFDYKDKKKEKKLSKKQRRKLAQKEARKKLNEIKKLNYKQCVCNHIGRNDGKLHIKPVRDEHGHVTGERCEICGDTFFVDPDLLTIPAISDAITQIKTAWSHIKVANAGLWSEEYEQHVVNGLLLLTETIPQLEVLLEDNKRRKKNKKKKKDKNGKKKKQKGINSSRAWGV